MKIYEQIAQHSLPSITERDFIKHPVRTTLLLFIGVPLSALAGVFAFMYFIVMPLGWIFGWY